VKLREVRIAADHRLSSPVKIIQLPEAIMRTVVSTNDAPKAIGPYSQAIKANGLIFVSGQTPLDPSTQQMIEGGVAEQAKRVLQNISGILKAAGSSMDKVVRCGVFLKDMNDFAVMNEVYATFFTSNPPARSTVQVSRLPKDCLVEIDAIALE
jgi:2-iminobutanoate/2-iminopropanoate deaminase